MIRGAWARLPIPHVLAALMIFFAAGCGSPGESLTYVYVVDYSGSTAGSRQQQLGVMLAELEGVPENTWVVVYRMGSDTQEVYSGPIGDTGLDSLTSMLTRDVALTDPVGGTDFAAMSEALVEFGNRFRGSQYHVRILTDGANDFAMDETNAKAYNAAAAKVAADERLTSLIFYGIEPGFRESLRATWGASSAPIEILTSDQMIGE